MLNLCLGVSVVPRMSCARKLRNKARPPTACHLPRSNTQQSSFWLPESQSSAQPSRVRRPDARPTSPYSGAPLKSKQLIPLQLERDEDSHAGKVLCAVTAKPIIHQAVVAFKSSGAVVLQRVADDILAHGGADPGDGSATSSSDLLKLVPGGSSFAGHNAVEAKVWKPSLA